jgi:PAS domain S-box-containing protein
MDRFKKNEALDLPTLLKQMVIIAFWETLFMTSFQYLPIASPFLEGLVNVVGLTLFSSISIWFFVIRPGKQQIRKDVAEEVNFLRQRITAIDQLSIISASDINGKITFANDNFCKISGYSKEELLGKDHRIVNSCLHSKDFFKHMWSTMMAGKTWRGQVRNKKKAGEHYWVDSSIIPILSTEGIPYEFLSVRHDITTEKNSEQALEQEKVKNIHMGRLAALGEMAGGIAHEINNPMAVITGLLAINNEKLLSENLSNEIPKILERSKKIDHQVSRIVKIIDGLRSFSHSESSEKLEEVSFKKIIESVLNLCEKKLKDLDVRVELDCGEINLNCHPIQIEQVILNLINNSADAIAEMDEKWIKIKTSMRGGFVEISITDAGHGIKEEIANKVMLPFFTTKPIGKGTGLGLSISRSIIESHGGSLLLDPSSANTRFIILLPQNDQALFEIINIDEAISAHLGWRQKLTSHLAKRDGSLDSERIGADNHCPLGRWIEKVEPVFRTNPTFIDLKSSHCEFHKTAGEITRRSNCGESLVAETVLGSNSEFDQYSKQVIASLHKLRKEKVD